MLNGIKNFLQFINDNWTTIIIIISLVIALVQKIRKYFSKSTEVKVDVAKTQIQEVILKLITDAEVDYETWNQAGSIKRSQVIQKIFAEYPILTKVSNQKEIIDWIDTTINESLKTLRKIITENQNISTETNEEAK